MIIREWRGRANGSKAEGHLEQHPFFSPWAPAEFQIELG